MRNFLAVPIRMADGKFISQMDVFYLRLEALAEAFINTALPSVFFYYFIF